ncbi:RHS repeat-associated core domain-containing protein [uncultured Chryseobacterium sp.]|uniref:RHS repeat domain-containing protein n=1 Tax=uncultured Chryseobacterium sp. TaxID=259322 RepID=UPI00338FCD1A
MLARASRSCPLIKTKHHCSGSGVCSFIIKNHYIYQYKDHLGNARISFARNSAGALEITDANDYYPFGMNHLKTGNAFFGSGTYKNYKYNGKELQESGMYDYGARMYMADIGRWGVVDPLPEIYRRYSPYNYTVNNPINFTDPDGRWVRGAGFFNNLFKSDARIHAEQWADKLGSGSYGVVVNKGSNGTWNVSSYTTNLSITDTFNSKGHVSTFYVGSAEGGGISTPPLSVDPWGTTFGSVPESRGKTDLQMQVSENPLVQGTVIDLLTGGTGAAISSLRTANRIRRLSSRVEKTASDIYASGSAPSAVVGAELNGQTVIGISADAPTEIAPQLQDVVEMLGGAGTRNINKTSVACCAEFHAGNELLLKNPQAFPSQINFTNAIRPRTGKVVQMFGNCKATFGK